MVGLSGHKHSFVAVQQHVIVKIIITTSGMVYKKDKRSSTII